MALRALHETGASATKISASICVVGAGMAGLVAATRLAQDKPRRVVVIESGLKNSDPALDILNEIENSSDKYDGATKLRLRALGGTSLLWSGKLLPITPHDTRPRPYLDLPGWPFDLAELDRYREEIESFLGVDHESYEEQISDKLDPASLLPRNDGEISLRWPKRPSLKNHNLAHIFRHEIEHLENLEIWLGATASGFSFCPTTGKIKNLIARNLAGQSLEVSAEEYLLAAGTLETTRLLLLADRQSNDSISRRTDALGRYFNDHLGLIPATLRPLDSTRTNAALSDRSTLSSERHLHFELKPEAREAGGVASAYCDFWAELANDSSLLISKQLLHDFPRGRFNLGGGTLGSLLRDSPTLFQTAHWQWIKRQKFWPRNASLQMNIWVEQLPMRQNRLSLSAQTDPLGLPRLKLEWRKTEMEEKTFQAVARKIDAYWNRHFSSICRLEWKPWAINPESRLIDSAYDLAHPAGSTRMGTDPSQAVVAPDLRVHHLPNLSIASASVFPTSGSANPTLTIMQLAMRAADAIAARLSA